jgi:hypothetical protein
MARRRLTAEEATARLVSGAQAAASRYTDGVRGYQGNPMEAAAAKAAKAQAGFVDAIQSGKWQRGLAAATREEWVAGATAGGGSAYVAGIQAKQGKIARKLGPALETTYAVADRIASMPTDTIQQRIAKSTAYQQARYEASRSGRSGR